jgi:hypothetical protein
MYRLQILLRTIVRVMLFSTAPGRQATEEGGPQMIEAVIVWTVDMALRLRHACFRVGISTFN